MALHFKGVQGTGRIDIPDMLDPKDPHQAPRLEWLDFAPHAREDVFAFFCSHYGRNQLLKSKKDFVEFVHLGGSFNRTEVIRKIEHLVNVWIDRYIANGKLEVLEDGSLRRPIPTVMVHYSEPGDKPDEVIHDPANGPLPSNVLDRKMTQNEWQHDRSGVRSALRERWRRARRAELTVGELEELLARVEAKE